MARATFIKVGGTWKQVTNIWRKSGASWENFINSYIKASGVWRICIEYAAPDVPTGLGIGQDANQPAHAGWNSASGAEAYNLQRYPQWNGSTWENTWKDVYVGASTTYDDDIVSEHQPDESQTFYYRVRSLAGSLYSDFSSTESINWLTGM